MPAKARRRKRPRARLKQAPILALLLIANVAAGIAYSPIFSTVKVRVVGAPIWDEPRLREILGEIHDLPWTKVNTAAVEAKVLSLGAVRTASLNRNPFGRGELRVAYRVPVAVLQRPNNVGLDRDGFLFTLHEPARDLPQLIPPATSWSSEITFAGSWPRTRIAEICQAVPNILVKRPIFVNAANADGVTLNNVSGATVVLGGTKDLSKKLEVLGKLLKSQPELMDTVAEINVSSPANVVTKAKGQPQ